MKKFKLTCMALCLMCLIISNCQTKTGINMKPTTKKLYWGDLHNHNAVGYAKGSLERSYDIAQSHLDFYCFTPHSMWPDMPIMPQNKHMKWVNGFEVTRKNWDHIKEMANSTYKPGKFVPFIGYEFHSSEWGDSHLVFPGSDAKLISFKTIDELHKYARETGALVIPHHPGYKQDWRGQNWASVDTSLSPVVEIFSEHGNAESILSPGRYIRHSMSGRYYPNTLQAFWSTGHVAGVIGSTDDHLGFPGAYGEGLAAVWADTLTREGIIEAIKARRTYGVSADRILLDFQLNGHYMGEILDYTNSRDLYVNVEGKGVIDRIEVLRNNQVIHREHPIDSNIQEPQCWDEPVLLRIEFGWGPWGDLSMARICDWNFEVLTDNADIVDATPCWQSGPFDENRRNKLLQIDKNKYHVQSYTSRKQAFEEHAANSVVLAIQGKPESVVKIKLKEPAEMEITKTLAELAKSNDIFFTGPFTSESVMIHRLAFSDQYKKTFQFTDTDGSDKQDWYYVRVIQSNGSMAWSSPIWIQGKP